MIKNKWIYGIINTIFFKLICYALFKTYLLKNLTRESKIMWMRILHMSISEIDQSVLANFFISNTKIYLYDFQFSLRYFFMLLYFIYHFGKWFSFLPKNWQVWHIVYLTLPICISQRQLQSRAFWDAVESRGRIKGKVFVMQAGFTWITRQIRIHYLAYRNKCIMTAEMTPMVTYDDRKKNLSVSAEESPADTWCGIVSSGCRKSDYHNTYLLIYAANISAVSQLIDKRLDFLYLKKKQTKIRNVYSTCVNNEQSNEL